MLVFKAMVLAGLVALLAACGNGAGPEPTQDRVPEQPATPTATPKPTDSQEAPGEPTDWDIEVWEFCVDLQDIGADQFQAEYGISPPQADLPLEDMTYPSAREVTTLLRQIHTAPSLEAVDDIYSEAEPVCAEWIAEERYLWATPPAR